ncbi:flagellar export protein FliJ [Shewanella eurypsychrophilus]|uniref:Flagellar FliJ protein n=1 Tax=Shewanella eurypsychrophilus TaxID=2593656 RepID=A0ABX6VA17_9GAMM|nr:MULTISPECIES: flagellar export protein FliJ [Shewanella]QFU23486.1 flagellar export protein FliJ [Shewanella sp. YLB-09]QPG58713.1 flagellar export protein FliJ [Shewanella eurypsychrophilus]
MAKSDPLLTVLKLANEAEEQASLQLKSAQLHFQKCQSQLDALRNYRLDYMKQMESHHGKTISASYYHQFHQFVRQVDDAITKQILTVTEADNQRKHRQLFWQEKQQKRKAVELLLEHKAKKAEKVALRLEQKMIDEFASQQFYRKRTR